MRDCASVAMGVQVVHVECTTIKKKKLPDVYFCEECIYKLIVITFLWYDS